MTNTRDIILQLKKVREERGLSYNDIIDLMEKSGKYPLAKSTISRVFSDGAEEMSFRYEETLKPLADVLLDLDNIEDYDSIDVQAMKTILKYKTQRIEDLQNQLRTVESALDKEKLRSIEKLEHEREQHAKSIEFLKNQIDLKDKRMDQLLDAVFKKDVLYNELLEKTMKCHCCPANKE